jgi:hypothetical protein
MRKTTAILCSTLFGCFVVFGDQMTAQQDGFFDDPATWGGTVPGSVDDARIRQYTVTLTNSATVSRFLGWGDASPGSLVIDGGTLTTVGSTSDVIGPAVDGDQSMIVKNGGSYVGSSSANLEVGSGSGATGILTVNNGTVSVGKNLLVGSGTAPDSIATITLNAGAVLSTGDGYDTILNGADGADVDIIVNSGASFNTKVLKFNEKGDATTSQKLTMNGGNLVLSAANASGALDFTDDNAELLYESADGKIVFEGVNTAGAFDSFSPIFADWVDAGNVTSTTFTDQELKDGLSFDGQDALLQIPEPKVLGLFIISSGTVLFLRRYIR